MRKLPERNSFLGGDKMAKRLSDEKIQNASCKKIDNVFKQNGHKIANPGDYLQKVKHNYIEYCKMYGTCRIDQVDPQKMGEMLRINYENAYSIKANVAALGFFKENSDSNVFKEKVNVIDRKGFLKELREEKVLRHSKDSTVMKTTSEQNSEIRREIGESRSPFKLQASLAFEIAEITTARTEGALGLKGKDITIEKDGTATVYLREKGNLERWVEVTDKSHVERLRELKEGLKNPNWTVIPPLRYSSGENKGKVVKYDVARTKVTKIVSAAAGKAGIHEAGKTVSMHSARKTAVQSRIDHYGKKTKEELKKEVDRRIARHKENEKKVQKERGENYKLTSVEDKYKTLVQRINWVNPKKGIRRTKVDREPNKKELAFFLGSLDSGHFRNDVMRFYAEWSKEYGF